MKTRTAVKWAIGVIAIVILIGAGAVVSLFVAFFVSMERGEEHRRQFVAELRSGKWDFGDQPALFAVAQGIVKNDPDAIRAAGKAVPELQAPGQDGKTLLYFAVTQSWQRPELVEAVKTLLSLGADPNYTKVTGTLSRWPTRCMRRRPFFAPCWKRVEIRTLAMSSAGQLFS